MGSGSFLTAAFLDVILGFEVFAAFTEPAATMELATFCFAVFAVLAGLLLLVAGVLGLSVGAVLDPDGVEAVEVDCFLW